MAEVRGQRRVAVRRFAILTTSDLIGGHEMQLIHLARGMSKEFSVTIVVTNCIAEKFFSEHGFDVRVARFRASGKIWRQWHAAGVLARILRTVIADCDAFIVSGGTIEACVAPARALKLLRPTECVTAYIPMYVDRASQFGIVGVAYNCVSRLFTRPIDKFITINRIQSALISHHYGRPCQVIPNVIRPIIRPRRDLGPRLIYVGRLDDRQKNVTGAIKMLDHADNPFSEFHIFGDGPDRDAIEARARSVRHITVSLHGWASHDQLSNELGRGDVLVMNSRWEGEPMIVRELAAAGIPTVGSDIPGFRGLLSRQSRFREQSDLLELLNQIYADIS